jgi:methionyl-tRNA formyltransferase
MLLQRGHTIAALISPDAALRRAAEERGIAAQPPAADLAAQLARTPFELLFSVVNYRVLPDALLRLPQRYAINYHDGPLPRYAGMYATSWAIMHGEQRHGVTWHLMAGAVDAGDILRQEIFALDPGETALSLNLKCYDAALRTFEALLDDLEAGTEAPQPQEVAERSYYARDRRPAAMRAKPRGFG